jgi:hypothetical protein
MWVKVFDQDEQGIVRKLYRQWAEFGVAGVAEELSTGHPSGCYPDLEICDGVELQGWGTLGLATECRGPGSAWSYLIAMDENQDDE